MPIAKLKSERKPDAHFSKKSNVGLEKSPLAQARDSAKLVLRTVEETWKSSEMEFIRDIHRKGEYWKHPVCKKCVESTSHHDETQG